MYAAFTSTVGLVTKSCENVLGQRNIGSVLFA